MADLGTAYVQIVPAATGIKGKITQAIAPESTAAGISAGKTISNTMGSQLNSIGGGMIKAGAIATAVSVPIVKGIKSAMSAYEVQNAAETKLTEIYKTRMGVTDKAAKKTMDYASALQKQGVIGDEVFLSGSQQLATFAKYPETINTLMPAMGNLLAQQKGLNATTQDATQIGNLMGKVMQGQTGALKRVGITFDENTEKILKNGTEQEKAAALAQVITDNVGNMNAKMAETPEGKIQQMRNSFADLAEKLGSTLAPALSDIAQWLSANLIPKIDELMNKFKGNDMFGKVVVGIAGALTAGGPLLILLGGITKALGGVLSSAAGAGGSVGGLGSIFKLLGGPVGIVVGLFTAMFAKSEEFRGAVMNLFKALGTSLMPILQTLGTAIQEVMTAVSPLITQIAGMLAPLIAQLTPLITSVVSAIGQIISALLAQLVPAIQKLVPVIQKIVSVVAAAMSRILAIVIPIVQRIIATVVPIITRIISIVANILGRVASTVRSVLGRVKSVFSSVWSAISNVVKRAIDRVKSIVGGLSALIGKVRSTFQSVRDAALRPIEAMRDKIKGIIDKVKGFFPLSIGNIFSNLKLPHFSVHGKAPFGIGGKGEKPGIDVSWYAKGGIMDTPTLFGGGEAGPEAILPLDPFWKKLDSYTANKGQTVNIYNYITVDGAENPENYGARLFRQMELQWKTV